MDGQMNHILIEFDPNGSLATTHKSQGSDMGLFGGFLGWEAYDERLPQSEKLIETAGIKIEFEILNIGAMHPNTYKLTLNSQHECHRLTAISTGGGMIEVIEIDRVKVSMGGDFYETLISVLPSRNSNSLYLPANGAVTGKHLYSNFFPELKWRTGLFGSAATGIVC